MEKKVERDMNLPFIASNDGFRDMDLETKIFSNKWFEMFIKRNDIQNFWWMNSEV